MADGAGGAGGEPGATPSTIGQIAAALRQDPVLLSPTMGNGHTAEIDAVLHQQAAASAVPVYVVLVPTPDGLESGDSPGPDEQLASLLHARLDRPGVYYVQTTEGSGSVLAFGVYTDRTDGGDPSTLLSLARYAGVQQVQDAAPGDAPLSAAGNASALLAITAGPTIPDGYPDDDLDHPAAVLTAGQVQTLSSATWLEPDYVSRYDHTPASSGLLAVVGVGVGISVAVVALRLTRAMSALRRRPRAAPADLDGLRAGASSALTELDAVLASDAAARAEPGRLLTAEQTRDHARRLLDSRDPLDLVGARVLALTGTAAVTGRRAYRPCYVNPTHGEATTEARVGGGLAVPVCRRCRSDVDRHRPADALLDARGRPYYLGRTDWARTGFGAVGDLLAAGRR